MIRRLTSILLALGMVLTTLPISATADTSVKFYNEEDVTWIGSKTDYAKTLEVFFDNGLRKVPIVTRSADGVQTSAKYGLVDSSGRWAAQPVYDKIQAEYWTGDSRWGTGIADANKPSEEIFVDGYVQASKNGKMGLLDSTGKEVIPCKYDAVGLPVEGVCRLIQKVGEQYFIGYWNLDLGKEIVKPNKYIADYSRGAAGSPFRFGTYYKPASESRMVCKFDFHGGYALVLTGKTETIKMNSYTDEGGGPDKIKWDGEIFDTKLSKIVYAQLIDKNGKEILPKPYPVLDISLLSENAYPQNGPYMVYQTVSTQKIKIQSDQGGGWKGFDKHLEEGVVGAKGVIIPAKYWGGFHANDGPGLYRFRPNPYGGQTELYPQENVIKVQEAAYTVSESSRVGITPKTKTINFEGKDVKTPIPKGSKPKSLDPDGNRGKIEIGNGIIAGVQAKKDSSGQEALFDVATGKQLSVYEYRLRSLGRGLFITAYGNEYGPDGKLVFPRAETRTVVKNNSNVKEQYVGEDLTLVVRDGQVGYVNATRLALNGKLPTTPRVKPSPEPMPDWSKWVQKNQEPIVAKEIVLPKDVDILDDGNYYMQIYGKYLSLVEIGFNEYGVQLSDKKPEYPFTIKLVDYDADRGPAYDITYNGGATWNANKNGDRFKFGKGGVDASTPKWKISKYTNFCTIRKYTNQALAVNASGAKSDNGTKITLWTYTGSAPEHAKIIFTKE